MAVASSSAPTPEAIREESLRIRRLRLIVDLVSSLIRQGDLPLPESVRLVQAVRQQALLLFPGKEETYDLVYAPRFARILRETYRVDPEN
jgi:hypothetical protein